MKFAKSTNCPIDFCHRLRPKVLCSCVSRLWGYWDFSELASTWVIKCPHWTSPNRYIWSRMATFSGDVQYSQNGTVTNPSSKNSGPKMAGKNDAFHATNRTSHGFPWWNPAVWAALPLRFPLQSLGESKDALAAEVRWLGFVHGTGCQEFLGRPSGANSPRKPWRDHSWIWPSYIYGNFVDNNGFYTLW